MSKKSEKLAEELRDYVLNKLEGLSDSDYIDALETIAVELEGMAECRREELSVDE